MTYQPNRPRAPPWAQRRGRGMRECGVQEERRAGANDSSCSPFASSPPPAPDPAGATPRLGAPE